MQQTKQKEEIIVSTPLSDQKTVLTAHASLDAVAIASTHQTAEAQSIEFFSVRKYGEEAGIVWPKRFYQSMDPDHYEDEEEDISHYQEMMALSRYRAFGDSSNFNELAAERINYGVRSSEVPFVLERIKIDEQRYLELPGELRGHQEMRNPNFSGDTFMEPHTPEEALEFICKLFKKTDVTLNQLNLQTIEGWLKPRFAEAVDKMATLVNMMQDAEADVEKLYEHLDLTEEEFNRARTTVKRDSIGRVWAYQSIHNIGDREGTVEDQSRQNDRNYSSNDQYHTWGERIDGRYILSEELEIARRTNLFDQLYWRGGEILNPEEVKLHGAKPVIAKPGQNKGWGERSVYYMRCARARDEVFAEKLWHIVTWPLDIVEKGMEHLRSDYKASVRANSGGPRKERVNGRWLTLPLTGEDAVKHVRQTGLGRLKGTPVSKKFNVLIGPTWHKLYLNREQMNELERALEWRKGIMNLKIGEETVKEPFNQTFEGLPREYVFSTYLKKK